MASTRRSGDLDTADDGLAAEGVPAKRRRRGLRITLLSLASVIVLLGAVAVGSFIYVNDIVGSIPRIPVKFLVKSSPSDGMTTLLPDADYGSAAVNSVEKTAAKSGMILLLHIDAGNKA